MCRSLGAALPESARLCDDPLGAAFAGPALGAFALAARRHPRALAPVVLHTPGLGHFVYYMQLRTRALDDALVDFVRAGGRQVVILGAGFDCRASRLRDRLEGARFFEIDHPATQAKKLATLAAERAETAPVTYVEWHFERDPMSALPAALAERGHDPTAPTLTIWEGVTMYLFEDAIEASVAAVRAYSAIGSTLAFTYFDRARLERPRAGWRALSRLVAARGEPYRFGWAPSELPAWLAARGFALESDRDARALADALLPQKHARRIRRGPAGRVAVARVVHHSSRM
jgi:methyltransferase (TIGR00027 family)